MLLGQRCSVWHPEVLAGRQAKAVSQLPAGIQECWELRSPEPQRWPWCWLASPLPGISGAGVSWGAGGPGPWPQERFLPPVRGSQA